MVRLRSDIRVLYIGLQHSTHPEGHPAPVKEKLLGTRRLLYRSLLPLENTLFFNRHNQLLKSTARIVKKMDIFVIFFAFEVSIFNQSCNKKL